MNNKPTCRNRTLALLRERGGVWTVPALAAELCYEEKTIGMYLRKLRAEGLVEHVQRSSRYRPGLYRAKEGQP